MKIETEEKCKDSDTTTGVEIVKTALEIPSEATNFKHKIKSRRVDYKLHNSLYFSSRFLFECGYKLKSDPVTIAIASTIFHRFFKHIETEYDKYLIAATSLFVAGKVRNEKYKLRDVINVAHQTLHRGGSPLDFKEEYWTRRDAIIQAELLLMRVLQFHIDSPDAHKYLLHYLSTLRTWVPSEIWNNVPLCQSSFAFLQDFHHDPIFLTFTPQLIAVGCINLAMQCYGVTVPCVPETETYSWFNVFIPDLKNDDIWVVMEAIMDVYSPESEKHE